MRVIILAGLFLAAMANPFFAVSQARGSIPEVLLRPARGESPRYPIDTVIGELGRGQASQSAFSFANSVCRALLSGQVRHTALSSIRSAERERYISALEIINPLTYRIGGGREEADGAVSFLVRFIGRDYAISGELYIRFVTKESTGEEQPAAQGSWTFEELLLDEPKDRDTEYEESIYRYDFNPYERFF